MKRKLFIRKFGLAFGKPLSMIEEERLSTGDFNWKTILRWGNKGLLFDIQNFQPQLTRLLPDGWAEATGKQWEPFICLALASKLFRPWPKEKTL